MSLALERLIVVDVIVVVEPLYLRASQASQPANRKSNQMVRDPDTARASNITKTQATARRAGESHRRATEKITRA